MKNERKLRTTIIAALIIVLSAIVVYFSLPFTLLMGYAVVESFRSDPYENVKPEITQGEFVISLTYAKNGETVTVSDVYVCEYYSYDAVTGKRRWGGQMQSTGKIGFVLHRNLKKEIVCWIGNADYYMGDTADLNSPLPVVAEFSRFSGSSGVIGEDELYERYGIKLISWECPLPIQNSFYDFLETE